MASAADNRRYETQRNQRKAMEAGMAHPRSLARSIAKAVNRASGQKESSISKSWRKFAANLPRYGRKYLHPESEQAVRRERAVKGVWPWETGLQKSRLQQPLHGGLIP